MIVFNNTLFQETVPSHAVWEDSTFFMSVVYSTENCPGAYAIIAPYTPYQDSLEPRNRDINDQETYELPKWWRVV